MICVCAVLLQLAVHRWPFQSQCVHVCVCDVATQVAGSDSDGHFEAAHIHDSVWSL